jgi:hypothetical protein
VDINMAITSDLDPRRTGKTVYEIKLNSTNPDDQAEVRIAQLLDTAGNVVHFTTGVGMADLLVNRVLTDVKHLASGEATNIRNTIQRGRNQGRWIILDGTTAAVSRAQALEGIRSFKEITAKHPGPSSQIEKVFIVLAVGSELVEFSRSTSLSELRWLGIRTKA